MKPTEQLTICICVRNGAKYLDSCLASIFAALGEDPVPVVAVDHLSTDTTGKILAAWRTKAKQLRIFSFEEEGIANVRNFAWQQAATPWVAFIDADCVLDPNWWRSAANHLRELRARPMVGGLGGQNTVPQAQPHWLYRAYSILLPTTVGGHGSLLNRPLQSRQLVNHLPTLNAIYRREALEKVGGFDPRFRRVAEDLDLSRRLRAGGFELWGCPEMRVDHFLRDSLSGWLRNMHVYGRGRAMFLREFPEQAELKFLLPVLVSATYLSSLAAIPFVGRAATWTLVVPALHTLAVALLLSRQVRFRRAGLLAWAQTTWLTVVTHLAYGAGMLHELVLGRNNSINGPARVADRPKLSRSA